MIFVPWLLADRRAGLAAARVGDGERVAEDGFAERVEERAGAADGDVAEARFERAAPGSEGRVEAASSEVADPASGEPHATRSMQQPATAIAAFMSVSVPQSSK